MESMEEIYQKHAREVFRYLMSLTGNPDLSEELTQETFYQAVKSADRFDGSSRITTWLCAIAKNQLLSYRRKHPDYEELDEKSAVSPSAESIVSGKEERVDLIRHLHALSDPYREVLYMRFFSDLSYREIGEILGKSENWARVTCFRGRELLRKEMEKHE